MGSPGVGGVQETQVGPLQSGEVQGIWVGSRGSGGAVDLEVVAGVPLVAGDMDAAVIIWVTGDRKGVTGVSTSTERTWK